MCNGLGTNPSCWPALADPDCGVRVVSWYHRGVGGSHRPADRSRVGIDAMVEDAVAVLDATGEDRAVLAGWSMGVNAAFQFATEYPERTRGLFAICGVPGGTFSTMLSPLRVPKPMRKPLTVGVTTTLSLGGAPLSPVVRVLGGLGATSTAVRYSRFILPRANPAQVRKVLAEFMRTEVDWYCRMAVATSRHGRVSLSAIDVPATFVSGRYDILAGPKEMRTAAERMSDARHVELPASHFAMLEFPDEVHAELLALVNRARP